MSAAASQAAAFYREVAANREAWTLEDDVGYPVPMTTSGKRAMPFWSSESRASRIVKTVAAYSTFRPVKFDWAALVAECADLAGQGMLVGVNWSGARATGYDVEPDRLLANIEYYLESR